MKLLYSPAAQQDLMDIKTYITNNLSNSIAAVNVISRITKRALLLRGSPRLGSPLSAITPVESDYYYLSCGNYTIFYRIKDNAVYVDRILYSRRNFTKILFGVDLAEEDVEE